MLTAKTLHMQERRCLRRASAHCYSCGLATLSVSKKLFVCCCFAALSSILQDPQDLS